MGEVVNAEQRRITVVVGLSNPPSEHVLRTAARLAQDLGAQLLCGCADPSQYIAETLPDGSQVVEPLDPDAQEGDDGRRVRERASRELHASVHRVLHDFTGDVEVHLLPGDPAAALAGLAHEVDAAYLVVGARHSGFKATMSEFFGGSVAVNLVHRQTRPVVVVPSDPLTDGGPMPWDDSMS